MRCPTVQAAAIGARVTYMVTYDVVNQLFSEGLISQDLRVTDAGRALLT